MSDLTLIRRFSGAPNLALCSIRESTITRITTGRAASSARPASLTGGAFSGPQAHVGHQLPGALEATTITELGHENHRAVALEAPESAASLHRFPVRGSEGELFNPTVQHRQVLLEHQTVLGPKWCLAQQAAKPLVVLFRPVPSLPVDEAPPPEDLSTLYRDFRIARGKVSRHRTKSAPV